MANLQIVSATPQHVPQILSFIQALAEFEKAPEAVDATESDIHEALFGDDATAAGLLCYQGDQAIGFAVYFYNFSTWTGKRGIYLEDLYVNPDYRGLGAGKALLVELAGIAVRSDCRRLEWSVLDWNTPAINFYESIGAKPLSEWTGYRLEGNALQKLGTA